MGLAHQMMLRRMVLRARWLPRLQNQEADDFSKEEFRYFDPLICIHVKLEDLGLETMSSLLKVGDEYLSDLEKMRETEKRKAEEKSAKRTSALTGGKRVKGLKETDPW